jgi:hypothetical protein
VLADHRQAAAVHHGQARPHQEHRQPGGLVRPQPGTARTGQPAGGRRPHRRRRSGDDEERDQIGTLHHLFDLHGLHGQVRWLGLHLEKQLAGELYRSVADSRGAFVQPALFEAFGLTVIEAMSCGLPTFATRYGGPRRSSKTASRAITSTPITARAALLIADFFRRCSEDPSHWDALSDGALAASRSATPGASTPSA